MKNKENFINNIKFIISWSFRLFVNIIGVLGLVLIAYEILALVFKSRWELLDNIAFFLSTLFTLIGVMLTSLSIYFYSEKPSPPEKIVAPVVIISSLISIFTLFKTNTLPANIVSGFALLAIAGALLRIHTNPLKDDRLYWNCTTNSSTGAQKTAPGED